MCELGWAQLQNIYADYDPASSSSSSNDLICQRRRLQMQIQVILLILFFYQNIPAVVSNKEVREGDRVEIQCEPSEVGTMVIWFRVLDNSGMEYIGSFSKDGVRKATPTALSTSFGVTNMNKNVLTLNSFKAKEDAGVYGCAGLKSNELKFGRVTRLSGVKKKVEEVTSVMVARTAPPNLPATTTACVCESPREETSLFLECPPIILGSLAGTCGLFILLLIITILYCNHMRTRRCPHHHKKRPRQMLPEKQMMTNPRH
uniref:Ig-like domain-containing protein n=1 Tax=Cynoglossus semilaevis TaxID=244447 RepID=A0A3P8VWV4_CYNSE